MRRLAVLLAALSGVEGAGCRAAPGRVERVRYVRGAALVCAFEIGPDAVSSVTGPLRVESRYAPDGALRDARAELAGGGEARVRVLEGRARVERPGQPAVEFEIPPRVIVTSAPDWTDVLLICRRWTRSGPERQEFPGLWIHPVQPPQRLAFSAERKGVDGPLERLLIRLRGGSAYLAWVDPEGRLIKLAGASGREELSLEGVDTSALKP